jgi:hypothetical protein
MGGYKLCGHQSSRCAFLIAEAILSVVGTTLEAVGTSAYVTMGLTFWIGGMLLFGSDAVPAEFRRALQRPLGATACNPEYPETAKGFPYRRNSDGSIAVLTANGPRTYKSLERVLDCDKSARILKPTERLDDDRRAGGREEFGRANRRASLG